MVQFLAHSILNTPHESIAKMLLAGKRVKQVDVLIGRH